MLSYKRPARAVWYYLGTRSNRLLAIAVTGVVVGALVVLAALGHSAKAQRSLVDTSASPKGWSLVPFGDVQVSVPGSWAVVLGGSDGCSTNRVPGALQVGGGRWCPPYMMYKPLPLPPILSLLWGARAEAQGRRELVNGVPVRELSRMEWSLPGGVEMTMKGQVPLRVVRTLSYSPRAEALLRPWSAPAPSGWRTLSVAGLGFSVPRSWPVAVLQTGPRCASDNVLPEAGVALVHGPPVISSCAGIGSLTQVAGIEVDAWDHHDY